MLLKISTNTGDREEVLECTGTIEDLKSLISRSIDAMTPEEKAELRRVLNEKLPSKNK